MNLHFRYISLILFILSAASCTDELVLADTWEGERLLIDAELAIDSKAKVLVSRTFNPILDSNPPNKYVTDAVLQLYRDDSLYSSFVYSDSANQYVSDQTVEVGYCYYLTVKSGVYDLESEEVCIPMVNIDFMVNELTVEDAVVTYEAQAVIGDLETDYVAMSSGLSRNLFMFYDPNAEPQFDSPCYADRRLDLDCFGTGLLGFSQELEIFNYTPSPQDSVVLTTFFISQALQNLRDANRYKDGEFELNGTFQSSFGEEAYGFIGYSYFKSTAFPFQ